MSTISDDRRGPHVQVPGMWPYDADIRGDGPSNPRIRAISVVLAALSSTHGGVVRFRAERLQRELLRADQIEAWAKAQPESSQPPAQWLSNIPMRRLKKVEDGSYLVPADVIDEAKKRSAGKLPQVDTEPRMDTRLLLYATPEREEASEVIREYGSTLYTLRELSRDLVLFQGGLWNEAHATTFILTGYAPLVPEDHFRLPSRPGRRQTEKALELAAFTALRLAEGVPPAKQFIEWNNRFPAWTYKDLPHFTYDGREAQRRLLDVIGPANPHESEPGNAKHHSDIDIREAEEE